MKARDGLRELWDRLEMSDRSREKRSACCRLNSFAFRYRSLFLLLDISSNSMKEESRDLCTVDPNIAIGRLVNG